MNTLFFQAVKKKVLGLIACMALLGVSQAGATSYNVSLDAGTLSVAGTITTDGYIGVLSNININDWNLTISGQGLPRQLIGNPANSTSFIFGTALSASSTDLSFNYGSPSSAYFQFQVLGNIMTMIAFQANGGTLGGDFYLGASCPPIICPGGLVFYTVNHGTVGTIAEVSQTPLPAALPLFATGLGALGLLGWRRKRKNAAAIAAA